MLLKNSMMSHLAPPCPTPQAKVFDLHPCITQQAEAFWTILHNPADTEFSVCPLCTT
jgi:hypothetical protein